MFGLSFAQSFAQSISGCEIAGGGSVFVDAGWGASSDSFGLMGVRYPVRRKPTLATGTSVLVLAAALAARNDEER